MTTTPVTMSIQIPRAIRDQLTAQGQSEFPREACGFLAGSGGRVTRVYPVRNDSDDGRWTYRMHGPDQLRAQNEIERDGLDIVAVYHSHPTTPAFPSPTDVTRAFWPDRDPVTGAHPMIFPEAAYVIISLADRERPTIRAFRLIQEEAVEFE
jgi:[CysO sulfur-carrier protein]-S-L-cysteine hydrolase